MTWEKTETDVAFYCDSIECGAVSMYNINKTRNDHPNPGISDFAACWGRASFNGWRSFKYRNWEYFCPKCAPAAEVTHQEHQRQEAERERIKARNAR
jgi:hypothetical protein